MFFPCLFFFSANRENIHSDNHHQQQQQQSKQPRQQTQNSHQHLLQQSLINLSGTQQATDSTSYSETSSGQAVLVQGQASAAIAIDPSSRDPSPHSNFRSISCSCESLKCGSATLPTSKAQKRAREGIDTDRESLICINNEDCSSLTPDHYTADDQRSVHSQRTSSRSGGVSKQQSYESYCGQHLFSSGGNTGKRHHRKNSCNSANRSPNSSTGAHSVACDEDCAGFALIEGSQRRQTLAYDSCKSSDLHGFSNSDPITRYSHFDYGSNIKTHYSDCNIYSKPQTEPSLSSYNFETGPDKQQIVNRTYFFKCIGNSPSFLKAKKISEQSKKLRNLSLKTRPVKKKSQIISKSNAVSDNSLHPGDKYLSLYLEDKRSGSSNSPSVAYGGYHHQTLGSRSQQQQQQIQVNGSVVKSSSPTPPFSAPTYRTTSLKSDTSPKDCASGIHSSSSSTLEKNHLQQQQQQQKRHSQQESTNSNKIDLKSSCKPNTIDNKLSVSSNSCNKLHVTHPYAAAALHKSSLSSNGHLNKYCLTDISRRKTNFNRQFSAPTDYSSNNGSYSAAEAVCESTSTVASASAVPIGGGVIRSPILNSSAAVLSQTASNSCTNSIKRRHIRRHKNAKLAERYVQKSI